MAIRFRKSFNHKITGVIFQVAVSIIQKTFCVSERAMRNQEIGTI
ncbi:hypothetical protein [Leptospira weilii]